jgi:hypothetical protein
MSRYAKDPRWLTVKYRCRCARCGTEIKPGQRGFYYPNGKKLLCDLPDCGKQASAEFEAAAFDESQNGSL